MPSAADDRCPRCGGAFHCGMRDTEPCACAGVTLSAAMQQQLRERYTGCLCLRCLRALAGGGAMDPCGPGAAQCGAGP